MALKITILGSGSAYGVPFIGGEWGNCDPENPKNRRTCPSILLENEDTKVLVDIGPDIRVQSERHSIGKVDGVILTHAHFDHIGGMGHLPVWTHHYSDSNMPLYSDRATRREIEKVWHYLFDPKINVEYTGQGKPYLVELIPYYPLTIGSMEILPFYQNHGSFRSLGLRVGNFAYCTDVNSFPEESFALLKDLDVFIVDNNTEFGQDKSHSYVEQNLRWIEELKPKQHSYFTHLDYSIDYNTLSAKLPDHVSLAYDGLIINI